MDETLDPARLSGPKNRHVKGLAGAILFALTPWLTLGYATPLVFLIAAVLYSHLGKIQAAVLWLSAVGYGAAVSVAFAELDAAPGSTGEHSFYACILISMIGGGLQAAGFAIVAAVRGYRRAAPSLEVFIVLLVLAGTAIVGIGAWQLPVAIRAARGQGVHGTVTPTARNCEPVTSPCSWTGNFVSDDGRIRLNGVDISGGADRIGRPQPALYAGKGLSPTVYPLRGSREWIDWIFVLLCGGCCLIVGGMLGWRRQPGKQRSIG
jgi:hypothetical protein